MGNKCDFNRKRDIRGQKETCGLSVANGWKDWDYCKRVCYRRFDKKCCNTQYAQVGIALDLDEDVSPDYKFAIQVGEDHGWDLTEWEDDILTQIEERAGCTWEEQDDGSLHCK